MALFTNVVFIVREHIPLEQGLRLVVTDDTEDEFNISTVREHIPVEQELRHNGIRWFCY